MAKSRLYYDDTIDVLRPYTADESVDLICLDPPLKSNRYCSVIFGEDKVNDEQSQAQIHAFEDTWHWTYVTR